MSTVTHRSPLWLAEAAALELQRVLYPVCERVAVAGSVRRKRETVGDIEVVVIPRVESVTPPGALFAEQCDRLAELCGIIAKGDHHLLRRPTVPDAQRAPPWGERYKKLLMLHGGRWLPVDLWITCKHRFGAIFAIRTGDADFSRLLVTRRCHGGAMPDQMRQRGGELQHCLGSDPLDDEAEWEPLYTPEEKDFFALLGLPVIRPEQRTEKTLKAALGRAKPEAVLLLNPKAANL